MTPGIMRPKVASQCDPSLQPGPSWNVSKETRKEKEKKRKNKSKITPQSQWKNNGPSGNDSQDYSALHIGFVS